ARYRLVGLTSNLQAANEVMATQKRINSISDDPIGLSQVLDLNTSLGNLAQVQKNVNMGISWLNGAENALSSVNELILNVKTQASQLINASMTASERRDAIGSINGMIDQIIGLGNTQINGNYIFSGTDTDTLPLKYHGKDNPPWVSYTGNKIPFEIKTDEKAKVRVGGVGSEIFWDDDVEINFANNTIIFQEDNGHGSASQRILKASIDDGRYTPGQLETALRNALNEVSSKDGHGVKYAVTYDGNKKSFSIQEDGSYKGFMRTEFMWDTGAKAYLTNISAGGTINPDDINLTIANRDALTISTPEPKGSKPFRLTWQGDGTWAVNNNPGYVIIPSVISGTDDTIGIDLNESGSPDIFITLDTPVTTRGQFIEFEIVSAQGDHSVGNEIGFNKANSIYAPPTSDKNAVFVTDLVISLGVNDTIEFVEVNSAGVASATLSATIANATYTDMDGLAAVIKAEMEAASVNGINYAVSYDAENSKFNIREDGSSLNKLQLLWSSSAATAATASTLGYYPLDDTISYPSSDNTAQLYITIDSTNNRLAFEETDGGGIPSGILWASVAEGTYKTAADFELAVETAMNTASITSGYSVTYDAAYNDATHKFSLQRLGGTVLTGLDLLWSTANSAGNSIGGTLGFDVSNDTGGGLGTAYTGDSDMVLMTFDGTNNVIDFEETSIDGTISDAVSILIPEGDYTDLDDVASAIQAALRKDSPNRVGYVVAYDYTAGKFTFKGSDANIKGFSLLWQTGNNRNQSADEMLGFYGDDKVTFFESDQAIVNITIDSTNNKIDFGEILKGKEGRKADALTASIEHNTYTSHSQLAREVEKALEEESYQNGNRIDYAVTWDDYTKKFTIKENGMALSGFNLLWQTGENSPLAAGGNGKSIGGLLGFDTQDDSAAPVESDRKVEWGIFNTLLDLNLYLADNDVDGIERTLGRLDAQFNNMTSEIVNVGIRYNRLDVRNQITTEVNLSLKERKSTIEDIDIVEATLNLQSIQTAYEAALSSTAKIIKLSLVDYL
ncbi:MAG: flagellar hook-associated protein FlgL, partial [Proteobacteria bacterium]|nr:flagellar hook-associated protein FlgL [Pseudomonadota bacterium]